MMKQIVNPGNYLYRVFLVWTFPGVVLHELAHKEFCRYYRIPVKEVCYFQVDEPAGYVVHARPKSYVIGFVIAIAPVFVNTVVAFACGILFAHFFFPFHGVFGFLEYTIRDGVGAFFSVWLGVSTGVHALPSRADAKEIWVQTKKNWYNPFVFIVLPVVVLIECFERLRFLYAHVLVGVIVFTAGVYTGLNIGVIHSFFYDLFVIGLWKPGSSF